MEIIHKDNGRNGVFKAMENGMEVGEMTYNWINKETIAINHTGVGMQNEGRGIGKQMVKKAAEFAREKNLKIVPVCPFVEALFQRDTNFQDIWGEY